MAKTKSKFQDYQCKICNKRLTDKAGLTQHVLLHSAGKPFECHLCPYTCKTKKYLGAHIRKVHRAATGNECDVCGKKFHFKCLLEKHMYTHTNERPYKCEVCNKGFNSGYSLRSHKLIHTGVKPYKCRFCDYACRDNSTLRKHQERHMGISRLFQCKACDKTYKTKRVLKIHVAQVHLELDVKTKPCADCGKMFATLKHLNNHVRMFHQRLFRCKCDICGVTLASKYNLRSHLNTHIDYRPFGCAFPGCGKRFKDRGTLSKHTIIHYPDKQFVCEVCGKRCTRPERLVRHRQQHVRKEKNVYCDHCGKAFYNKNYVRSHITRKHMFRQPFVCALCGLTTYNKPSLVMHLKYGHVSEADRQCRICKKRYKKHIYLKLHYWNTHCVKYKMNQHALRKRRTRADTAEARAELQQLDPVLDIKVERLSESEQEPREVEREGEEVSEEAPAELTADEKKFEDFFIQHIIMPTTSAAAHELQNTHIAVDYESQQQAERVKGVMLQRWRRRRDVAQHKGLTRHRDWSDVKTENIDSESESDVPLTTYKTKKKKKKKKSEKQNNKQKAKSKEMGDTQYVYSTTEVDKQINEYIIYEQNDQQDSPEMNTEKEIVSKNCNRITLTSTNNNDKRIGENELHDSNAELQNIKSNEIIENDFKELLENTESAVKKNLNNQTKNIVSNSNGDNISNQEEVTTNELRDVSEMLASTENETHLIIERVFSISSVSKDNENNLVEHTTAISHGVDNDDTINNEAIENTELKKRNGRTASTNNEKQILIEESFSGETNIIIENNVQENKTVHRNNVTNNITNTVSDRTDNYEMSYNKDEEITKNSVKVSEKLTLAVKDEKLRNISNCKVIIGKCSEIFIKRQLRQQQMEPRKKRCVENTKEDVNNKNEEITNNSYKETDKLTLALKDEKLRNVSNCKVIIGKSSEIFIKKQQRQQTKKSRKKRCVENLKEDVNNDCTEKNAGKKDSNDKQASPENNRNVTTSQSVAGETDAANTESNLLEETTRLRKRGRVRTVVKDVDSPEDDDTDDDDDYTPDGDDTDEERKTACNKFKINSHQCYVCFKLFDTKEKLLVHCKEHFDVCDTKMLKKCPLCTYATKFDLTRHIKLVHKINLKILYGTLKARKTNNNKSEFYFDVENDEINEIKVIPSIKNLNRQAFLKIDRQRRDKNDKGLNTTKLIKKNGEWIVEKEALKLKVKEGNHDVPELGDKEKRLKDCADDYVAKMKRLSTIAKNNGQKMLFPCESCEKVCQTLSALTLHMRRHNPNAKPFKKKVWKHKLTEEQLKEYEAQKNPKAKANENRFRKPKPIVNKHKCDPKLKEFYEKNIKGGDIEFWQFLKIFNKMTRDNINDFSDLENRPEFGNHHYNPPNPPIQKVQEAKPVEVKEKRVENKVRKSNNKFIRSIMISKKEYKKRKAIQARLRKKNSAISNA